MIMEDNDLNATRELSKLGKGIRFMNKKQMTVILPNDSESRALDLVQNGEKSFSNSILLALNSLSYRKNVNGYTVQIANVTPKQLLDRTHEYDDKITASEAEQSLETAVNAGVISKLSAIIKAKPTVKSDNDGSKKHFLN